MLTFDPLVAATFLLCLTLVHTRPIINRDLSNMCQPRSGPAQGHVRQPRCIGAGGNYPQTGSAPYQVNPSTSNRRTSWRGAQAQGVQFRSLKNRNSRPVYARQRQPAVPRSGSAQQTPNNWAQWRNQYSRGTPLDKPLGINRQNGVQHQRYGNRNSAFSSRALSIPPPNNPKPPRMIPLKPVYPRKRNQNAARANGAMGPKYQPRYQQGVYRGYQPSYYQPTNPYVYRSYSG